MTDLDERLLLDTTLRRLAETYDGAELSKALDDFGFLELLCESASGAVPTLFHAMGNSGSISTALHLVMTAALASSPDDAPRLHQTVLLPSLGRPFAGTLLNGSLTLRGLTLGGVPGADLIAAVSTPEGVAWVKVAGETVSAHGVGGLDPALGIIAHSGSELPFDLVPTADDGALTWGRVTAAARRAIGYQILGAVNQMIELAREHALNRVQFGRPVGTFQAVRHRLAEALVAHEAASAALEFSWDSEDEVLAAMLAKSLAGRAAKIAAAQCQQVLAGIGFTAEHPFHHFLNRVLVLDRVMGSSSELPAAIGARLAGTGKIPRLAEL
jgi:hypothetical protein